MKRILLVLFAAFVLAGCGKDLSKLNESLSSVQEDEELSVYLESIDYEVSKSQYFYINGTLDNSFDELSTFERHEFFKKMTNIFREVNKDNGGYISCGKGETCYLLSLRFKTAENSYYISYEEDEDWEEFEINSEEITEDFLLVEKELSNIVQQELIVELDSAQYVKEKEHIVIKGSTNLADGIELSVLLVPDDGSNDYPLTGESAVVKDGEFEVVLGEKVWDDVGREIVRNGDFIIEANLRESEKLIEIYQNFERFSRTFEVTNGELRSSSDDGFNVYDINMGTMSITNGYSKEYIEKKKLENKKSKYETLGYAHLNKNPERYKGDLVKFRGEIAQIMEGDNRTVIRLAVSQSSYGYTYNDIIWVDYNGYTDFIDGDIITVYGKITGSHTYTSQADWEITIPSMDGDIIE